MQLNLGHAVAINKCIYLCTMMSIMKQMRIKSKFNIIQYNLNIMPPHIITCNSSRGPISIGSRSMCCNFDILPLCATVVLTNRVALH